jgi:hypothetical protein
MDSPRNPFDPDFDQPQDTGQPARGRSQQTWFAQGQGSERGGMKNPSQPSRSGIAPAENEGKEGQTAPNLREHVDPIPQKGGASQTGRSGGFDRKQDLNKQNREGEMPKSESDIFDEPPFDSRMPGEPPRGADNTAPDES